MVARISAACAVICAATAPDVLIRLLPASGTVDIPEPSLQGPLAQKNGSAAENPCLQPSAPADLSPLAHRLSPLRFSSGFLLLISIF